MTEKEKKEKEKKEGIDFGMGLGGIFDGIGGLIESISKMAEEGASKVGEIKGLGDKVKGVYGFTIRTLAGGECKVEPFGNIKKTPEGPVVEEEREPLTDVFDEKSEILVIAEIPGVHEEGIAVDLKGDILEISAAGKNRTYYKEILLPAKVKPETLSHSYKNGVLEIRIKK